MQKPVMHKLWRNDPATPEGKYLVKRRDGSVVEWPNFTLGARDPAAVWALRAYAVAGILYGFTWGMQRDVWRLAREFRQYRREHGNGDPDRGRHRVDDPATIEQMKLGRSA